MNKTDILLLDKNINGHSIIKDLIQSRITADCHLYHYESLEAAQKDIQDINGVMEVILLNLSSIENGLNSLNELVKTVIKDVPIITFTHSQDEDLMKEAIKVGASDNVVIERFLQFPERLTDAITISSIREANAKKLEMLN